MPTMEPLVCGEWDSSVDGTDVAVHGASSYRPKTCRTLHVFVPNVQNSARFVEKRAELDQNVQSSARFWSCTIILQCSPLLLQNGDSWVSFMSPRVGSAREM